MVPYNRRLWAYPLEEMSFDWIAERVPSPKMEEVINGALMPPEKKYGPNAVFWYPKRGGMEALVKALYNKIDRSRLKVEAEVVRICVKQRFVELADGEKVYFQKLISTLPLPYLVQIMDAPPEDVRQAAQTLAYNTIYAVNFGLAREGVGGNFHWLYLPEDEFIFHRVSFPHNLSPFNVPEGRSALTCEVSASPYKAVDESTIVGQCIEGLKKLGFIRGDNEILVSSTFKLSPAYVIYTKGHREAKARIRAFLEKNGIYSCGRFGEWEYFNMDHSILSGKRAAKKALEEERIGKIPV